MKSILLPTDFSKISLNAIDYVMELFKEEECIFYVLNIQKAASFVSDDLMTMSSSTTIYQTLIDTAKKSIKNVVNTIEAYYKNDKHQFISVVDYDNFIDGINQMCEANNIDLIVMGTKGATGAERVLFGSNTVRVMQRCKTPVLAIPDKCKFKGINKIAFTSDYLSKYKADELEPLLYFANIFNARVDVLHMMKSNELTDAEKANKDYIDELLLDVNHIFIDLEKNDLYRKVQDYIENNNIKLLAMSSKKHSFIDRLFNTHNVEKFGSKIDIPFLVMEDTAE